MYAIGHVVYGFPLTSDIYRALAIHEAILNRVAYEEDDWDFKDGVPEELIIELLSEAHEFLLDGMETVYHGSNSIVPGWYGKKLGAIDECNHVLVTDLIAMSPEHDEQQALLKTFNEMPAVVREAALPMNVYIIWGSS